MQPCQAIANLPSSYIREILAAATAPGVISLAGGLPAPTSFPLDLLDAATAALAGQGQLLQYGETRGFEPLLNWLSASYQLVAGQGLVITNGSQQGLDLIARTYLDDTTQVVVETPAYLGAIGVFAATRTTIKTVNQTPQGPDLNALENIFRHQHVVLFYAVPDFHNPTGVCWDLNTRQQVARLCRQYGVTLVEDAPYRDIRFAGDLLPLVSSFCPAESLVVRSFSKTVAPGLRLGVVTGPKPWVNDLIKLKQSTDLHTNLPMQFVLHHLLTNNKFSEHHRDLCRLYKSRYENFVKVLQLELPQLTFAPVNGGMFIWLNLLSITDQDGYALALAKRCLANKVAVVPGDVFYPAGAKPPAPALRLNFSYASEAEIPAAIQRLKQCL